MDKEVRYLINRIAEDDDEAFRIFYDRFYIKIYRYTSYYVKSIDIREEIVSDVFFNFWVNRKKNPSIENPEGYLYTMVKNTALSYMSNKEDTTFEINEHFQEELSDTKTPENIIIDEEIAVAIKNAIDDLPERCRLIFLMAREEGLKYREIAELLSISEKTVNAQMVLAIKKLSKRLGRLLTLFFML